MYKYLESIEWLLAHSPPYLTLECNIGPRRPPESNIGTSATNALWQSPGLILHS